MFGLAQKAKFCFFFFHWALTKFHFGEKCFEENFFTGLDERKCRNFRGDVIALLCFCVSVLFG